MNFSFTEATRFAVAAARHEANRLGHDYVGTEHLLLGLLGHWERDAGVLSELRIDAAAVRRRLNEAVKTGRALGLGGGELPYTSRAKKALEYTMEEARALGATVLEPDHLLLGLLREENGIAAIVLRSFGATVERVREVLRSGVRNAPEQALRITIDESSDRSIYEQIVSFVQEAVATGSVRPGERLPTVRRLADDLDIAPGTVARAYGELERLGVVVTEGARGTRVAEPRAAAPHGPDGSTLVGLLRPVAVAAFHMGARAADLRAALDEAMKGIFTEPPEIP